MTDKRVPELIALTLVVIRDITPRDRLQECLCVVVVLMNGSRMAVSYAVLLSAGIGLPKSQCEGRSKVLLAIHRTHPRVSHPGFGATNLREIVRSGVGSRK